MGGRVSGMAMVQSAIEDDAAHVLPLPVRSPLYTSPHTHTHTHTLPVVTRCSCVAEPKPTTFTDVWEGGVGMMHDCEGSPTPSLLSPPHPSPALTRSTYSSSHDGHHATGSCAPEQRGWVQSGRVSGAEDGLVVPRTG